MDQANKQVYFEQAKNNLKSSIEIIKKTLQKTKDNVSKLQKSLHTFNEDDKIVQSKLLTLDKEKLEGLELMQNSPYFNKCELNDETIYIGKFSLSEQSIYSWISPIAKIRFEHPGQVRYTLPDKTERQGTMTRKDQYMIVDGKIIYLSTESLGQPRELVYQDYFSNQKKNFVLPEIVAQMEKAQDSVIRASYKNSLLISGPAGSGKTTLALHRVAYLLQSPDVADKFQTSKILILVQDNGTKEYFSHLLPELGIKNITIHTFADWVMSVLDLQNYNYQNHIEINEEERDYLEYYKLQSLKDIPEQKYSSNIFFLLEKTYQNLPTKYLKIIKQQKENNILDRIDLTILLQIFKKNSWRYHNNARVLSTKKTWRQSKKSWTLPCSLRPNNF